MYRWLRNTHLFLGLFSFLFLMMYGLSSVQMAHGTWFNNKPDVTESTHPIPPESATDARTIARTLMERHAMHGELQQVRQTPNGVSFMINRPGTIYQVEYARDAAQAKVRTNVANFIGMLNRIHHVRGLWHEYPLINAWAVFVGVVSAALILLSLTGIYLWFKIYKERLIGIMMLTVSLGYSLTLMILIRME